MLYLCGWVPRGYHLKAGGISVCSWDCSLLMCECIAIKLLQVGCYAGRGMVVPTTCWEDREVDWGKDCLSATEQILPILAF